MFSRRRLLTSASGVAFTRYAFASPGIPPELRTPHKAGRLVVRASGKPGAFDSQSVDCPYVFHHAGLYYMAFVAFDGTGYQTGLASSTDLLDWRPEGMIAGRDPSNPVLRYNVALNWIVRENDVFSDGSLKRIRGRFLGVYHAYPSPGYEEGPAVIGLCWSKDLRAWKFDAPCLRPQDGGDWERGGLYKPCLLEHDGTFYLFYNAKTAAARGWREQTGLAVSTDLRTWTRNPGNPVIPNGPAGSADEIFASDPCVLRFGRQWALFYYSLDAKGVARDVLALSTDLRQAVKCEGVLIDVGPAGSVDARYAHKPSVIARDGILYHFYCAVASDGTRGISVAASRPLLAR
jgi:predicted GH43/DUF377 family glycosyl hydrolase